MTDYRATPEQWAETEQWAEHKDNSDACILELRARVEALEIAENDRRYRECSKLIDEATPKQIRAAVAPARSLVDRVARAIGRDDEPINWEPESRAAIREVAAWMREKEGGEFIIRRLELEAER
jgi:hypothetical protein